MTFSVNTSPFAGQDGKYVTSRNLRERLFKERYTDVSLRVEETDSPDAFIVSGRGELHLSILIENMRRQGFEFQVSKPTVIYKTIDGKLHEPMEKVLIDVPDENMGTVIEKLGRRKGEILSIKESGGGRVKLEFSIPSRGLLDIVLNFDRYQRRRNYNSIFDDISPTRRYTTKAAWFTGCL